MSYRTLLLLPLAVAAAMAPLAALSIQEAGLQRAPKLRIPVTTESEAMADAPEPAATLKVFWDGRVTAGDALLHDPAKDEDREALRSWLKAEADKMDKRAIESAPELGELPDGLLLVYCDETAAMNHLQRLLVDCASTVPPVWNIHLGTVHRKGEGVEAEFVPGRLNVSLLPKGKVSPLSEPRPEAEDQSSPEPVEVSVKVIAPGSKRTVPTGQPWGGDPKEHFYFDRGSRKLEFKWGPRSFSDMETLKGTLEMASQGAKLRKTAAPSLILTMAKGTTVSDAAWIMDTALSVGFEQISFSEAQ